MPTRLLLAMLLTACAPTTTDTDDTEDTDDTDPTGPPIGRIGVWTITSVTPGADTCGGGPRFTTGEELDWESTTDGGYLLANQACTVSAPDFTCGATFEDSDAGTTNTTRSSVDGTFLTTESFVMTVTFDLSCDGPDCDDMLPCSTEADLETVWTRERVDYNDRIDTIVSLTGNAAAGGPLWQTNCAGCHGDDGSGGSGGPETSGPAMPNDLTPVRLIEVALEGRGFMPSFAALEDAEIADLAAFVLDDLTTGG